MTKALSDLCIIISLCNRMSLASMLHREDRPAPSSCQITSFAGIVIFRYISLYFRIFPYISLFFSFSPIVMKFVVRFVITNIHFYCVDIINESGRGNNLCACDFKCRREQAKVRCRNYCH